MEKGHPQQGKEDEESNEAVDSSSSRTELSGKPIIFFPKKAGLKLMGFLIMQCINHTSLLPPLVLKLCNHLLQAMSTHQQMKLPLYCQKVLNNLRNTDVTHALLLGCARDSICGPCHMIQTGVLYKLSLFPAAFVIIES